MDIVGASSYWRVKLENNARREAARTNAAAAHCRDAVIAESPQHYMTDDERRKHSITMSYVAHAEERATQLVERERLQIARSMLQTMRTAQGSK